MALERVKFTAEMFSTLYGGLRCRDGFFRSQRDQAVQIVADDPCERRFREQPARDDSCWCWRNLDAEVKAGTRVLHPLMLDDAYLFGNHVELFAGLHTDLNRRMAVVRAEALRLGQFVPHDLARQVRIERFASALAARVPGNLRGGFVLTCGGGVSTECFGLVRPC